MPSFLSSRQRQALHLAWRFIRPYRKQALAALLEHHAPQRLLLVGTSFDQLPAWIRQWQRVDPALLSAVDLKHDYRDGLVAKEEAGLYRAILGRTFGIAAITTLVCVLLAFPLCAFLDKRTPRTRNALLLLILLPFWTSILVRTTAWMVLLQDEGLVNAWLLRLGLVDSPLHLLYNRFGVILALVHVMLPFMVFPLLAAMAGCNRLLVQAAYSMGARPLRVFLQVYLPQVLPGLAAGALMVFIVTLGFYITPALLGGPADQMISFYIAQFTTGTLNWGLASALGLILLVATTLLYLVQAHLARRGHEGAKR